MAQAADSGSYYDFGGDGAQRRKLRIAELLMGEGSSTAPVQHWTQGLARALQGGMGGWVMHKTEAAEKDRNEAQFRQLAALVSGGAPPSSPASAGGASNSPTVKAFIDRENTAVLAPTGESGVYERATGTEPGASVVVASEPAEHGSGSPVYGASGQRMPLSGVAKALLGTHDRFAFAGPAAAEAFGQGSGAPPQPSGPMPTPAAPGGPLPSQYVDAIKGFEGFTPTPAWDYRQYSSGYGTKALPGEGPLSQEEAEQRLQIELSQARGLVQALGVPMTEGQEAALTSLTYNAGTKWMNSGLGEAVRKGDWETADRLFREYVNAGGKPLKGLENRRNAEAAWMQPTSATAGRPPAATPAAAQAAGLELDDATKNYYLGLVANPATRNAGLQFLNGILQDRAKRAAKANEPLNPLEQAQLEKLQLETQAKAREGAKANNLGQNISGGLDRLAAIPDEFTPWTFESAVGTYQGDKDAWISGPLLRTWGSLVNFGRERHTSEVRNRIDGDTEALATAIKPLIRAPGEGQWSDADQARLVAVVGNLAQANDAAEYYRALEGVRQRVMSNFGIQLPPINIPGRGQAPQANPSDAFRNVTDEQLLQGLGLR